MGKQNVLRPRWGTFSVIDHKNPVSLVPEILLYDRLVFPTPTDDDRKRWTKRGWKPELLDQRVKELGDLVHTTPWTDGLRKEWAKRWERLKQIGKDTEGLAMGLTPHLLALSAWKDQVPPPVMIAAYQDPEAARLDLYLGETTEEKKPRQELHREVAALFERSLAMPIVKDPERVYKEAIELAHEETYQHARRSLFEWEDRRVADEWPTAASIKELEELVASHDDIIKRKFRQTWKRRVFYVVQLVAPAVVTVATANPFIGLAAGGTLKVVELSFPSITAKPEDPADHPGAALHMPLRAMSHEGLAA